MLEAGYAAPELATKAQKLAELILLEAISQLETDIRWNGEAILRHFEIKELLND